jgi:hypothetical protein
MEDGEVIEGNVTWFGREAVGITPPGGNDDKLFVVQRGWVADWRRADNPAWEVTS